LQLLFDFVQPEEAESFHIVCELVNSEESETQCPIENAVFHQGRLRESKWQEEEEQERCSESRGDEGSSFACSSEDQQHGSARLWVEA